MASEAAKIGAMGEDAAIDWLRREGFLIVARNWRDGRYELDIVAQRGFSLHFVEVKSRLKSGWSTPEEAITNNKRTALMRGVNSYLASHPTDLEPQVDLIAVDIMEDGRCEVRYIPYAIESRW